MPTSARGFDNRAVGFDQPVPPVRSRGDVGIAPYAKGGILPFIRARFFGGLGFPHPARAAKLIPGSGPYPAPRQHGLKSAHIVGSNAYKQGLHVCL